MARSLFKGPFCGYSVIRKSHKKNQKKQRLKIWSRNSTILPIHKNLFFQVHNGKNFIPLHVTEDCIGHKFGEFASTRKSAIFKRKKIQKR
uniref:Small ribosomal subunit protein uS19m n=1 Tax=Ancoracysta twista TaxID=2044563 RepID=A0A2H4R8I1_9EUKA|nr:ribosomal protein S19 [Ancoracysta twista]ATY40954.1 ribosomal protein S19 [Ancoracysta twista]